MDIFIRDCCENTLKNLKLLLSDISPADFEYDFNKTIICNSFKDIVEKNRFNTFLCENWESIGQFVIIQSFSINSFSVKFKGVKILGKLQQNLGLSLYNRILVLLKIFSFLETTLVNKAFSKPGQVISQFNVPLTKSETIRLTDNDFMNFVHTLTAINNWALIDLLGSYQVKAIGMVHRRDCCKFY